MLDNQQVPLEPSEETIESVQETAIEVAEGIRSQQLRPHALLLGLHRCDFQLICPAAEK